MKRCALRPSYWTEQQTRALCFSTWPQLIFIFQRLMRLQSWGSANRSRLKFRVSAWAWKKKISLSAEVIQVLEIFFLRGLNVLYLNFKAQSKSVFSFSFSFSFFFAFRPHTLFWVCTISYLNQSGMKWWV